MLKDEVGQPRFTNERVAVIRTVDRAAFRAELTIAGAGERSGFPIRSDFDLDCPQVAIIVSAASHSARYWVNRIDGVVPEPIW